MCLGNTCVQLPAMWGESGRCFERAAELRLREAGEPCQVPEPHRFGQVFGDVFRDSSELPLCQTAHRSRGVLWPETQEIDASRDCETVDVQLAELIRPFEFRGETLR